MIARQLTFLVLAVMVGSIVISHAGSRDVAPGSIRLQGAGSTFAAPL
jgi:hypothetical protein